MGIQESYRLPSGRILKPFQGNLSEAVEKIRNLLKVENEGILLAYLFGSRARPGSNRLSDVDIGILVNEVSEKLYRKLWSEISQILKIGQLDLIILNSATPLLCYQVISEGKLIYYRSVDILNRFEQFVLWEYRDTQPLRQVQDQYLIERARKWF